MSWQPTATLKNLQHRTKVINTIRDFFILRGVLEVETPLLSRTSVTDPYIESLSVNIKHGSSDKYYLQTSPEYAMKRLLAAYQCDIFQICKAFRQDEIGKCHNPEFTILEWYRINFDHHDLMDEVDALLQTILKTKKADRISYAELFQNYCGINPHEASLYMLKTIASSDSIMLTEDDKDTWLQLIMTHHIEPQLKKRDRPVFIYDFPITQSALARIKQGDPKTASRFEVYYQGIELANGFHELKDANEQRARFENNLIERRKRALSEMPLDEHFLSALQSGLPDCAGVALGLDRLVMLDVGNVNIKEVISFNDF